MTVRKHFGTLCVTAVLALMISGCVSLGTVKDKTVAAYKATAQATKKTARKIGKLATLDFSSDKLRRKAGVAVVKENDALPGVGAALQNGLVGSLTQRCDRILLVKPGDSGFPDYLQAPPRRPDGRVANFELAKAGKQEGFNALISMTVTGLRINQEQRGLMWMRDLARFVEIVVDVEVVDTETAAKLLDETMVREIPIEVLEEDGPLPPLEGYQKQIDAKLAEMGVEMADQVCEMVAGRPWGAFVTGLTGDRLVLSAGAMSGLVANQVLDVVDSGNVVEGKQGERFFVPGKKTGQIKIVAVYPDRAEAVSLSGEVIWAGSVVKLPD